MRSVWVYDRKDGIFKLIARSEENLVRYLANHPDTKTISFVSYDFEKDVARAREEKRNESGD